jgi:pSer/pThr/pTyr-binding forkhead associated (FHA) protein
MILTRPQLLIGRAESCDIGLFGDAGVERFHARLDRLADGYVLTDAGSPAGTYVNGRRIHAPTPLHSGDVIGVGAALLRFEERRKRPPA